MEINLTQSILDLRTLVAKSTLSRLRAFLGALLAKILWVGAQKHCKELGSFYRFSYIRAFLMIANSVPVTVLQCCAVADCLS